MWNTIRIFQNIFENQGIFFKNGQKKHRKINVILDKTKFFFCKKKWKRQKKAGDAKVDKKKNSENHRNHKEGQTEQDNMCPPKN